MKSIKILKLVTAVSAFIKAIKAELFKKEKACKKKRKLQVSKTKVVLYSSAN